MLNLIGLNPEEQGLVDLLTRHSRILRDHFDREVIGVSVHDLDAWPRLSDWLDEDPSVPPGVIRIKDSLGNLLDVVKPVEPDSPVS